MQVKRDIFMLIHSLDKDKSGMQKKKQKGMILTKLGTFGMF